MSIKNNPTPGSTVTDAVRQCLGTNLHRARIAAGLSQEDLAQAIGVSRSRWNRFENGHDLPTLDHMLQLARTFGCTVGALLGEGEGGPAPNRWAGLEAVSFAAERLRRQGVMVALAAAPEGWSPNALNPSGAGLAARCTARLYQMTVPVAQQRAVQGCGETVAEAFFQALSLWNEREENHASQATG